MCTLLWHGLPSGAVAGLQTEPHPACHSPMNVKNQLRALENGFCKDVELTDVVWWWEIGMKRKEWCNKFISGYVARRGHRPQRQAYTIL